MLEWSAQKGYHLYNMVELYEREAVKATDQLYELINSSDVPLDLPIYLKRCGVVRTPISEVPLRFL